MESLERNIALIKDDFTRGVMQVCQRRREYPKDCINDGALDQVVKYILELEEKCAGPD